MIKISNKHGEINIVSDVFTKLTGDAATNCFGVKGMAVRSVTDGLVHLLKKESMGKGVHITYNKDNTISIELHIAIDQGVNIPAICDSIMHRVSYQVANGTGIEVKRVDIFIDTMLLG